MKYFRGNSYHLISGVIRDLLAQESIDPRGLFVIADLGDNERHFAEVY